MQDRTDKVNISHALFATDIQYSSRHGLYEWTHPRKTHAVRVTIRMREEHMTVVDIGRITVWFVESLQVVMTRLIQVAVHMRTEPRK